MKLLSEKYALSKMRKLKDDFRQKINHYEKRAQSCETCETKGACCLDAHFVNVHITRLEAILIKDELRKCSTEKFKEIYKRIDETVERYNLGSEGDTFQKTFACPLFEKGIGCLVHSVKPIPCIQHACYEHQKDLPPDELQEIAEQKIERLNKRTYGRTSWMPLPVWLQKL